MDEGNSNELATMQEYIWTIIMKDGDAQHGKADSFEKAMQALSAWHGDGTLHDIAGLVICPVKKDLNI